jgi:hypothetical protein
MNISSVTRSSFVVKSVKSQLTLILPGVAMYVLVWITLFRPSNPKSTICSDFVDIFISDS